ncbi:MAG: tetratricopeptide repeat protein [Anaerolineae bacterium]
MSGGLFRPRLIIVSLALTLTVTPVLAQQGTPTPAPTTQATAPFLGLASDVFQRARTELEAGDYASALLDFSLFLTLNPTSSQAFFGQALSLLSLERPDEALQSIDRALETGQDSTPYRAALLNARSQIHLALELPDEAIADLSAAIELNPTAQTYADRARLYAGQEDYGAAITDLDTALTLSPDDPQLFLFRAYLHNQVQDPTAAGADYFQYINAIGTDVSRNDPLVSGQIVYTSLEEGLVQLFTFDARAGQTASLIAQGRPGDQVDPLIVLIGPAGQPLAGDDDSGGDLSSLLSNVPLPSDGTYSVLLSHALGGTTGQVAIAVQLSGGTAPTLTAPTPTPGR